MKLAEALLERANLKTKINVLESRLINNSRVQEGMKPNENPEELLDELEKTITKFTDLTCRINKTNENTKIENKSLSFLLSKRDGLTIKLRVLRNFVESGSNLASRITHSEIRVLSTFDVSKKQKEMDDLAKEIRKIDTKIQELNWTTELL